MSVLPNMNTPVERCEHKSLHTCTMLDKFSATPALTGLSAKLGAAMSALLAKQASYQEKVKTLIVIRVEVKYVDRISDQAVRVLLKRAEIADGKPNGRIATTLFPAGTTPIIKPVGGTQVKEMRALEGRCKESAGFYPDAIAEQEKLQVLRERYEQSLEARRLGLEEAAQARAARDLAKEDFLDVFAEVAHRIRAAFPRDKQTQDLFFLKDKDSDGDAPDEADEPSGGGEA